MSRHYRVHNLCGLAFLPALVVVLALAGCGTAGTMVPAPTATPFGAGPLPPQAARPQGSPLPSAVPTLDGCPQWPMPIPVVTQGPDPVPGTAIPRGPQTFSANQGCYGRVIILQVGDRLRFDLSSDREWYVHTDPQILAPISDQSPGAVPWLYEARQPGLFTLNMDETLPCDNETPPCGHSSLGGRLWIVVR